MVRSRRWRARWPTPTRRPGAGPGRDGSSRLVAAATSRATRAEGGDEHDQHGQGDPGGHTGRVGGRLRCSRRWWRRRSRPRGRRGVTARRPRPALRFGRGLRSGSRTARGRPVCRGPPRARRRGRRACSRGPRATPERTRSAGTSLVVVGVVGVGVWASWSGSSWASWGSARAPRGRGRRAGRARRVPPCCHARATAAARAPGGR